MNKFLFQGFLYIFLLGYIYERFINFSLAAFPKYVQLQMSPASGTVIPKSGNGVLTQTVKVNNGMYGEVLDLKFTRNK